MDRLCRRLAFAALEDVEVFSSTGDVQTTAVFDEASQMFLLEFSSPTGTFNATDGPLAVLYFRLRETLVPKQTFQLAIDLENTFVIPADGEPVTVRPKPGRLRVRGDGSLRRLEAASSAVSPGGVARIGIGTREPFAVANGLVAFSYDPALVAGSPAVAMDYRHGEALFAVDSRVPGRLLVSFQSDDHSLNRVPGELISIFLPISPAAPPGTRSTVVLDPELSFLEDERGERIELELLTGTLEISAGESD